MSLLDLTSSGPEASVALEESFEISSPVCVNRTSSTKVLSDTFLNDPLCSLMREIRNGKDSLAESVLGQALRDMDIGLAMA